MLRQTKLWLHTAVQLRPVQVKSRVRALVAPPKPPPPPPRVPETAPFALPGFIRNAALNPVFIQKLVRHFERAGKSKDPWSTFPGSPLEKYQLHGFHYVHALDSYPGAPPAREMIRSWLLLIPPGAKPAWEPFPLSSRVVNWIRAAAAAAGEPVGSDLFLRSLFHQLMFLERNVEYRVMGNHLIRNAAALVLGGLFFAGADAAGWLEKGLKILSTEIPEQVLGDGGHFELSPMYHCFVLEDLLDVSAALSANPAPPRLSSLRERTLDLLRGKIPHMLRWLETIIHPDGGIPLFNDSVFLEAPAPRLLFERARALTGGDAPRPSASPPPASSLEHSGYHVIRRGKLFAVIDAGPFSPSYLPAHGHCDLFSYELSVSGRRLVVDTGVYDYHHPEKRRACRATAAHNTLRADRGEQSETWGCFRAARRAAPLSASLTARDGALVFTGVMRCAASGIRHRRTIFSLETGVWVVLDAVLEPRGTHFLESFVHLHPDAAVEPLKNAGGRAGLLLKTPCGNFTLVPVGAADDVSVASGSYHPAFWTEEENRVVTVSGAVPAGRSLGYAVVPV
ncbi:MAG: heparinase II/III family protein [bacterium]